MAGQRVLLLVIVVVYPLIKGEMNTRKWETKGNTSTSTAATSIVPATITISKLNKTRKSKNVTLSTGEKRKEVPKIKKRSSFMVEPQPFEFAHLRHVRRCPDVNYFNPVDVKRILGFWYAYATTPIAHPLFRLECSPYDASYFNFTNIFLTTDYIHYAIMYYCVHNNKTKEYDITLRVLTRNTSPSKILVRTIKTDLSSWGLNSDIMVWLGHKAYCFEWFIRSNHDRRRHYRYLAPYNRWNDH